MSALAHQLIRLSRLPQRFRDDTRIVRLLHNWKAALMAEWQRTSLQEMRFRNGVVLQAPDAIHLSFIFHEIWVRQVYTPKGYEIKPNSVVIDIGANIGVFATYAATRAPGVKVFCYEPFAENVSWLMQNLVNSGLSNVQVRAEAVAGVAEERQLVIHPQFWSHNSLSGSVGDSDNGVTVACVTLVDIFEREGLQHCDLLKVDCEGAEYEILENTPPYVFARVKQVVCEYHDGGITKRNGETLCNLLRGHGFRIDSLRTEDKSSGVFCATNLQFRLNTK